MSKPKLVQALNVKVVGGRKAFSNITFEIKEMFTVIFKYLYPTLGAKAVKVKIVSAMKPDYPECPDYNETPLFIREVTEFGVMADVKLTNADSSFRQVLISVDGLEHQETKTILEGISPRVARHGGNWIIQKSEKAGDKKPPIKESAKDKEEWLPIVEAIVEAYIPTDEESDAASKTSEAEIERLAQDCAAAEASEPAEIEQSPQEGLMPSEKIAICLQKVIERLPAGGSFASRDVQKVVKADYKNSEYALDVYSRVLMSAVDSGQLIRHGKGAGTRYTVAEKPYEAPDLEVAEIERASSPDPFRQLVSGLMESKTIFNWEDIRSAISEHSSPSIFGAEKSQQRWIMHLVDGNFLIRVGRGKFCSPDKRAQAEAELVSLRSGDEREDSCEEHDGEEKIPSVETSMQDEQGDLEYNLKVLEESIKLCLSEYVRRGLTPAVDLDALELHLKETLKQLGLANEHLKQACESLEEKGSLIRITGDPLCWRGVGFCLGGEPERVPQDTVDEAPTAPDAGLVEGEADEVVPAPVVDHVEEVTVSISYEDMIRKISNDMSETDVLIEAAREELAPLEVKVAEIQAILADHLKAVQDKQSRLKELIARRDKLANTLEPLKELQ